MTAFVVDASVATKWVVPEPYSDKAQLLLNGPALTAPAHWQAEAVNIVWGLVARGRWKPDEALAASAMLIEAPVEPVPLGKHLRRALDLSLRFHNTVYDTLYVALAEAAGIPFVTDDHRLLRKMRAAGMGDIGLAIEDFSCP